MGASEEYCVHESTFDGQSSSDPFSGAADLPAGPAHTDGAHWAEVAPLATSAGLLSHPASGKLTS